MQRLHMFPEEAGHIVLPSKGEGMLGRKTHWCLAAAHCPSPIPLLTITAVPQLSLRTALGGSYKGHQHFRQWLEKLWPPLDPVLFLLA